MGISLRDKRWHDLSYPVSLWDYVHFWSVNVVKKKTKRCRKKLCDTVFIKEGNSELWCIFKDVRQETLSKDSYLYKDNLEFFIPTTKERTLMILISHLYFGICWPYKSILTSQYSYYYRDFWFVWRTFVILHFPSRWKSLCFTEEWEKAKLILLTFVLLYPL